MSTDFAPGLQKKYSEKVQLLFLDATKLIHIKCCPNFQVVPALLASLDDLNCPRVAANAAAALVNFSEDAPKSVVLAYLDRFMAKFQQVLKDSLQMVRLIFNEFKNELCSTQ